VATATLVVDRRETDTSRIIRAGLTVAVLDALFAIALYVVVLRVTTVPRVFQSIAAGLLGRASYAGGAATVALGVVCHLTVAFGWTTLFYLILRRLTSVRDLLESNAGSLAVGLVYGAIIWLGMDFIVIPISRATQTPVMNWRFWLMLAWHSIGVGLPIVRILRAATR
jgi:hypothetical protein